MGGVNERPSLNTLYLAPKTEKEQQLANVWTNVLSMDRVGVRDNFFELGGTSLKAVQLISEIKREVGLQVPIVNLFAEPTIEALARFAEGDAESDSGDKGERVQQRGAARRGALKRRRKPR